MSTQTVFFSNFRRFFLLLLLTLSVSRAADLECGLPFLRNYTPKDYGAAPQNWAVTQDPRGVLYVANTEGILEFDGVRWRKIRVPNGTAARALDLDGQGRVYVGAVGEIGYLAPDTIGRTTYVSLLDCVPTAQRNFMGISFLRATAQGVYFLGANRLMRIRGREYRAWEGVFTGLFELGGRVFTSEHGRGLLELQGDSLELVPGGERLAKERLCFMEPWGQASGTFLVGTRNGLYLLNPDGLEPMDKVKGLQPSADLLYRANRLPDGSVAMGTLRNGLQCLDPSGNLVWQMGKTSGLRDDTVLNGWPGKGHGLFLGLNDGIAWIEMSMALTRFGENSGLHGGVLSVHKHQGQLYVGTDVGVFRLVTRAGAWPRFEAVPGVSNQCWSLLSVGEDLLVANNDGLIVIRKGKAQKVGHLTDLWCFCASQVEPGRIFVGLEGGVAALRRHGDAWIEEGRIPGVGESVRTLVETSDGRLWVGTGNQGLVRVSFGKGWHGGSMGAVKVERFGLEHGLPSLNHNRACTVGGEPLFATHQGLYRFDAPAARFIPDPRFRALYPSPRWIFAIDQGVGGSLWMHSCEESHSLHETGCARQREDGTFQWDVSALLPVSDTGVECIYTDPEGIVWVGSSEGLFRFNPKAVPAETSLPQVLIRRVALGNGNLVFDGDGRIPLERPRLTYKNNRLRFEYALPVFEKPEANLYQVLLEGYDHDWSGWSAEAFKEYTNLHEGNYRLRIRARDCHGRLAPEASYDFCILAPWFRTWWAYGGLILLAAGLGYALFRWRLWWLQKENRALERRVAQRTQELAEANQNLKAAQEQVARLMESPQDMLENIPAWATMVAEDLERILQVQELAVYEIRQERLIPLRPLSVQAPDLTEVSRALTTDSRIGDLRLVGARGLTGELRGVLMVRGASREEAGAERQLLLGFATQFGGALEMVEVKQRLVDAEFHHTAVLEDLHARGIETLSICPKCGLCFGHHVSKCPEDHSALVGQGAQPLRVLERYRLTRRLGSGGMGTVYEAWDEHLSRVVAVKVLLPERFNDATARLRFEREARCLVQINHPGVVTVFDSGEVGDGSMFLIMERLRGVDLGRLLHQRGPGSPSQVAQLVRRAGAALDAAHRSRIIHRDIKPQNIFLIQAEDGFQPKLLDFGLAKADGMDKHLTQTGFMVGTPLYMAPEQILGKDVDERSDFFSFAAVIYEALLGRQAAGGLVLADIIQNILYTQATVPSSILPWLKPEIDSLLLGALAKAPEDRPKDFLAWTQALADQLEACGKQGEGWPQTLDDLGPSALDSLRLGLEMTSCLELPEQGDIETTRTVPRNPEA